VSNHKLFDTKEFLMTDDIMMQFIELFCPVDDFCLEFEPEYNKRLLEDGTRKRIRKSRLCLSEIMTIIIWFHRSGYRTFKDYYTREVCTHLRWAFPRLVSYNRFVELMPGALLPLCCYLMTRKGRCSGISFIDSMPIAVCHNRRIHSHRVFSHVAERGKTTMGWFYGFKAHLIVNDQGELLAFRLTSGNVDDREPVPEMVKDIFGKLFGDKGYISQKLFEIVCTQMTKEFFFSLWACRDHIADLHFLIVNNDTVNEQGYQLPALLECKRIQCWPNTLTEITNACC
jgi:hypothetical protein